MLQDLAKELGIPSWIVDLRHRAAHGSSCPSLPLLREAAEFCLKWLYVSKTESLISQKYVLVTLRYLRLLERILGER